MTKTYGSDQQLARVIALDYLRVLAVIILFFFHLAMIWLPNWDFHFKQMTSWYWLQHIAMLFTPWRMGLLWFIAGTALYFMQAKHGSSYLLTKRSNAILLPLLFGILFVVPVQLYAEMSQKAQLSMSFFEFSWHFYFADNQFFSDFSSGIWHHIDVNHLWFLRSLWYFTIILILIKYPLALLQQSFPTFNRYWLLSLLLLTLMTMNIESSDLKRDVYGFICLLTGYLFGSSEQFWQWLKDKIRIILVVALLLIMSYQIGYGIYQDNQVIQWVTSIAYNLAKITSLLAVLAIAHVSFVKPNALVTKATPYVFPFYVIHQSALIGCAFIISDFGLPPYLATLMTLLTSASICLLILLMCKYNSVFALLLGKRPKQNSQLATPRYQALITLMTLPLAFRLLGFI